MPGLFAFGACEIEAQGLSPASLPSAPRTELVPAPWSKRFQVVPSATKLPWDQFGRSPSVRAESIMPAPPSAALRQAEQHYEAILKKDGRSFDAAYRLGLIRLQQNRFAEAEILFRRAVKLDKKSADAQHHLAIALTGAGRLDEAVMHYRKALKLQPRDAAAHNNLGYALQKLDRHDAAARHFREALSLSPSYPEALNNLGNALQALEQTEEAVEKYREALALRPNYAEAYSNLASALAVRNLYAEAIDNCRRALALAPNNPQAHLNLANALGALERPQESLDHYRKAIALDPASAEAYARAAGILFHLGRIEDSIVHCEKALAIRPDHVDALRNRGVAQRAVGKLDAAIASFEQAIAASPKQAPGLYYNLATSKRVRASDPHFAAMKQMAAEIASFKVEEQIGLHFALGKAYADVDDHRRSFTHLLQGNALKRELFADHDEAKLLKRFERIAATFSAELLARKAGAGDPSPVPIFIIGMPRSGTSLVEQILASHPKVFGAGERYEFGELVDAVAGADGTIFPEAVTAMSGDELHALGASYVRAMRALAPDAARITDKMPGNFFSAGLIHLALPDARIIHIQRDRRDNALSCFSILFAMGHAYTYDLAELGRYIRAYEKLMAHWRKVLPAGAMLDIRYEELVADLETQAKRLVEFCGLEWDSACLSFHKTERPVRTASVIQVRQPIYGSSVGRWQPYEKELEPFLRAFSDA
jgi:tetratricopeptide (TPR) repeat protein